MSEDNLSKVANECAEKLRGMEAVIPPPIPKPSVIRVELEPFPFKSFTVNHSYPEPLWYEDLVNLGAVIAMASGFIALGFAIASGVR